jgi:hypothetical protein
MPRGRLKIWKAQYPKHSPIKGRLIFKDQINVED